MNLTEDAPFERRISRALEAEVEGRLLKLRLVVGSRWLVHGLFGVRRGSRQPRKTVPSRRSARGGDRGDRGPEMQAFVATQVKRWRPIGARVRVAMAQIQSPFHDVPLAPPDPILGVTDAFNADQNPKKVNLGVGVYQDGQGKIPVLRTVHEAEKRWVELETSKAYLPIDGLPAYRADVAEQFGPDHPLSKAGQVVIAQALGGTGALRIGGDFLRRFLPNSELWLSTPTWRSHRAVFQAAGFKVNEYPYYDPETRGLAFGPMASALRALPAASIVLLHGCCHNPTGVDLTPENWLEVVNIVERARPRAFHRSRLPGLRRRPRTRRFRGARVRRRGGADGGLELVLEILLALPRARRRDHVRDCRRRRSQARDLATQTHHPARTTRIRARTARRIAAMILSDAELRKSWEAELTEMRERIVRMRALFVQKLAAKQQARDFSFVQQQRGMFSYSGLELPRVQRLRSEFGIYGWNTAAACAWRR